MSTSLAPCRNRLAACASAPRQAPRSGLGFLTSVHRFAMRPTHLRCYYEYSYVYDNVRAVDYSRTLYLTVNCTVIDAQVSSQGQGASGPTSRAELHGLSSVEWQCCACVHEAADMRRGPLKGSSIR